MNAHECVIAPLSETTAAVQKIERKKLDLQPRTKPVEAEAQAEVVEAPVQPKRSTSIFGAAKPVDTAAKEKEIEQRLQRDRELLHKKVSHCFFLHSLAILFFSVFCVRMTDSLMLIQSTDGPAPLQENADPATGHVSAGRRRTSERTISQSSVEATADAPRLAPQKILQRPRPPPEAVQEAPLTEGAEDNVQQSNKPPLGTYKPGRNVRTFTRGGSGVARYQGGSVFV
jgi:translation initiation factor 4B